MFAVLIKFVCLLGVLESQHVSDIGESEVYLSLVFAQCSSLIDSVMSEG